jgi:metal-responsive CopG/Arc/MetJ family transcriptional regulator
MSRTKRINISIPEDMLKEIDEAVKNAKTGRSRFFRQAVRYYLTKGTIQDLRGRGERCKRKNRRISGYCEIKQVHCGRE